MDLMESQERKQIKNWNKNQPSGRWRSIKQIRIKYTYILQTLYYEEKTYTQKFICPLGMVKYMKKVLKDQKLFHPFNVFPNAVKEAFSFTTSADYDHDKLKIQCEDEGDKGYDNFCFILLYLLKGQVPRLHQKVQRSSA